MVEENKFLIVGILVERGIVTPLDIVEFNTLGTFFLIKKMDPLYVITF